MEDTVSENLPSTPAMNQYYEIKSAYPDSILFFRMGDFYEMFGPDAEEASKILGIALTARNKNSKNSVPLCGIPYHSYLPYLVKLLKAGKKVAICEQLEDARLAKGVVKRGVTRVVTPATVVEEEALTSADNNFLLGVYSEPHTLYVAAADVSTGETYLKKIRADKADEAASGWTAREIISNDGLEIAGFQVQKRPCPKNYAQALRKVLDHYGATSERSLHIEEQGFVRALAMVLEYFDDLMLNTRLCRPVSLSSEETLVIDGVAARTLELVENQTRGTEGTLFQVLDHTNTPMGGRFLKKTILRPSRNESVINARLDAVEYLKNNPEFLSALRGLLNEVYDIERIAGRLLSGKAAPRDLAWLKMSIKNVPEIDAMLKSAGDGIFDAYAMNSVKDVYDLIEKAIVDDPPVQMKDGGIIRDGFNKYVDEFREVRRSGGKLLAEIEEKEKKASGIGQLKVGYNKVFGYYIEVSKSNLSKVPPHFERKQTLVGCERFVTAELKDLENKILNADEKLSELEYHVFKSVRDYARDKAGELRELARILGETDFLASLAYAAAKYRYSRPLVNRSGKLFVKDGRHPVVEAAKPAAFVPNDFDLDQKENRLSLVTGPNMSGKSTYLRSAALIAVMAHMGSFVPAAEAEIGIMDRIFTRVGASDNLSRGESTFMVEMVETANILSNATKNSLIILDEIGRGTSTFDGVSIAWSVAEHILNKIGAKALFATHYHELTEIASAGSGAKNYTVDVREWQNEIIFLRKVIPGTADKSYGIYVGKLAGLPESVTKRAEEILGHLEKHEALNLDCPASEKRDRIVQPILVFDDSHPAVEALKDLDADNITPIEALRLVHELKKKAYL